MDDGSTRRRPARRPARDPPTDDPNGAGQYDVGLPADPGRTEEPWPSAGSIHDRPDLADHGIGPVPERPTSWRTFLAAHWDAIAAADFFITEVWTARGLVTFYRLFVIELASRRVHLVGSTPHPDDPFMVQIDRTLTHADDGALLNHRITDLRPGHEMERGVSADVGGRWGSSHPHAVPRPQRQRVCRTVCATTAQRGDCRGNAVNSMQPGCIRDEGRPLGL